MIKRAIAGTAAIIGIGAYVATGFNSSESSTKPGPDGQVIGHWEGRPFIPGDTEIDRFTKVGDMTLYLYDGGAQGNYATISFKGPHNTSVGAIMTCANDHTLDFSQDYDHIPTVVDTHLPRAHFEESNDFAATVCRTGTLTVALVQTLANEPKVK